MNLKIQHRNFDISRGLRELIEKKTGKVAHMLPTFSNQALDLHVTLERLPRGRQYRATLVLALPQIAIRAEDIEADPAHSVLRAFDELRRRVKKFKSQLNREKFWQRQPVLVTPESATGEQQDIVQAINNCLDRVDNYIRRELYRQALLESLPSGLLQPHALLDEVFLAARADAAARPEALTVEQWMIQIARDRVQKRVQELGDNWDQPHVEETAPNSERWYDEPLNFYQPDEVLRVEDLLADEHCVTPEDLLARHEREEQLQKEIARLPQTIRDSFVLYVLEGFNSDEIAMITGKSPGRVLEDVQEARTLLRQRLNADEVDQQRTADASGA
ncbi:MAG: HPF/RaiA family ribosome-associated protein [Acidobacteria bacterium]|nr:HPF/RaiA family ribosome-associated protein [Acidobacteriota bacterium]